MTANQAGRDPVLLSFVIPAFNEAAHIGRCVASVERYVPTGVPHEVVVVDNGSTDATAAIAAEAGAVVVPSDAPTVAAVRNDGIAASRGSVLVFLDADCALTEAWHSGILQILEEIDGVPLLCAGSQVFPPRSPTVFLWDYWFTPFAFQPDASHIGSAHMICARATVDVLSGFREDLETGEDFDFCARLMAAGGQVLNVPDLRVEHHDFPRSWGEFFARERWHGRGDASSFAALLASKVAIASLLFSTLLLCAAGAVITGAWPVALAAGIATAALVMAATALKLRHAGPRSMLAGLVILPVYFLARATAVLDMLFKPRTKSAP